MRRCSTALAFSVIIAACSPPPDAGAADRESVNKQLVERFVAAINARDLAALDTLVAPDVVRRSPSTPGVTVNSLEELKAFLRQDLAAVPDNVQTIQTLVAEGDWVAIWATYAGTQTGPLGPFPASGKRVDLEFSAMLRIENGRIADIRVVWDNVAMLTQLGHMTPPGAAGT